MSDPERNTPSLEQLERTLAALDKKVDAASKGGSDAMGRWSPLVTPIVVAVIGTYATCTYNQRQQENQQARDRAEVAVQQVQTVEKFFPHLTSGEARQVEVALKVIKALGNDTLSIELARLLGDSGSRAALSTFALGGDSATAVGATAALSELELSARPSVVRIESVARGAPVANGFFVDARGLILTTAFVADMLKSEGANARLANGLTVPATVVKVDPTRDLALLQAKITEPVAPLNRPYGVPELGMQVIALGQRPKGEAANVPWTWTVRVGTVTTVSADVPMGGFAGGPATLTGRIITTAVSEPGLAGAPVLDLGGALIGVVEGGRSGGAGKPGALSVLIPARVVREALQQWLSGSP